MNCCPSGKCVNLLYMYSILGRGCFCFNYCLNSAWHGGDQFVALLRWCEAQVSLTSAFSSSACFGLLFLIFLLTILHRFSGVQAWSVCWPVKHTNQGPRVWRKGGEAQSPSCLKSNVKFPQSVMIWVQCHLLVLVHCVFWKLTSLH